MSDNEKLELLDKLIKIGWYEHNSTNGYEYFIIQVDKELDSELYKQVEDIIFNRG